jgi:hypothetical protein
VAGSVSGEVAAIEMIVEGLPVDKKALHGLGGQGRTS